MSRLPLGRKAAHNRGFSRTTVPTPHQQVLRRAMSETFILIPGRTSKQGCGISEGKFEQGYQSEINTLQVAPRGHAALGLNEGDACG